ncbi:winged helix-turn-helix domain-containing protein [Sphingomonas sp. RS6]
MAGTIASALDIPNLAEAAARRGLRLVPYAAGIDAEALVLPGGARSRGDVARIRSAGWRGLLILVLPRGGDIAEALDAGADDAVALPTSAGEIAARLAARLRGRHRLFLGGIEIDLLARSARRDGRALNLLPREFALLLHLARNAGRTVSRDELLAAVWGLRFDPGTNVVEVHVSRLRAKLDRDTPDRLLRTDKGRGYRLVDPAAERN